MRVFRVILQGKIIDTMVCFTTQNESAEDIKKFLIAKEGFDARIEVREEPVDPKYDSSTNS